MQVILRCYFFFIPSLSNDIDEKWSDVLGNDLERASFFPSIFPHSKIKQAKKSPASSHKRQADSWIFTYSQLIH